MKIRITEAIRERFQQPDGTVVYFNDKMQFHREDGPAIVYPPWPECECHVVEEWWVNGKKHRIGAPAITWSDGTRHWYESGRMHRLDGPALVLPKGTSRWYVNGSEVDSTTKDKDKWLLIKGGLESNLPCLNEIGMDLGMQEHIVQTRPDLIDKIKKLHPSLKANYKHELSLSKVDL